MLRLDLARLRRDGSVRVEAAIPAEHPMWHGTGVAFGGPVEVRLKASAAGSGEVVVRGTVAGVLTQECRRCLAEVPGKLSEELTMVFAHAEATEAADDGDIRFIEAGTSALDLSDAIREEVILAADPYVVCGPECKGLCPRCGANRNLEKCACAWQEVDPRWDALRTLKKE